MKFSPYLFVFVSSILSEILAHSYPDCVDAQRILRCVLPTNCPTNDVVDKRCPLGRICCKKDRPNPYLPLRRAPLYYNSEISFNNRERNFTTNRTTTTTTIATTSTTTMEKNRHLVADNGRIIFPDEIGSTSSELGSFRVGSSFSLPGEKPLVETTTKKLSWRDLRKSAIYCREYAKLTIDVGYATPLLNKLVPLRYEMENCDPSFNHLVVGGSEVPISDFPHMVALGFNLTGEGADYLCGGSLISDEYVLTAAHCIQTKWGEPIEVRLGATDLRSSKGKKLAVQEAIVHPGYNSPSCYNDIALIKLAEKIKLTPKLRPACLPNDETKAQFPGSIIVATGWGRTGFAREASPILQKVALKVINNKKCGDYYKTDMSTQRLNKGIRSDMICAAGYRDVSHDTCQGDSGGPLQSYLADNRCMLQIVGITSFGKSCGTGVPGVYTRVSRFLTWIENIVWP